MVERPTPRRFRRRLTAAFAVTAALSSGLLAVTTYGVASGYRWRNFREMTQDEVRVALALSPQTLDASSFERLLGAYEKRSGTDTIAITADGRAYSSSALIGANDVPLGLLEGEPGKLVIADVDRDNKSYVLVAGTGASDVRYVFFFSLDQLESSLTELRAVLLSGWVVIVIGSLAIGHVVAGRTLRPVREAADAAAALAGGLLDTRLDVTDAQDEFGVWAESFNTMADALEAKIDELARAAERERRFTSDVAHDLRTPLTGMTATAILLQDHLDDLPEASRRPVAVLVNDVARLKDLVVDLLELSRLDAGAEPVDAEALDVAVALRATIDSLKLPDDVAVTVTSQAGLWVVAARGRFRRVLGNLVANAATHGRGAITINAQRCGPDVVIEVLDDGPGIPDEHIERIFDRFYKSDESRAAGGSGLGLAIAREHARAQLGDITAGRRPEGGARFVLTLPATTDPSDADSDVL